MLSAQLILLGEALVGRYSDNRSKGLMPPLYPLKEVGILFPNMRISLRLVHQDLGALRTPMRHSREESSQFGHKETGSRARRHRVARNPVVVIGIFLV